MTAMSAALAPSPATLLRHATTPLPRYTSYPTAPHFGPLAAEDYAAWLDPAVTEASLVRELAGEFPPAEMEAYPVGRAVGNPRAQGPTLIQPVDA